MTLPSDTDLRTIPVLLKHMTVAIFKKLEGKEKKRFMDAIKIARASLVKNHLALDNEKGPISCVHLTAKGQKANHSHRTDNPRSTFAFNHLFEQYAADMDLAYVSAAGGETKVDAADGTLPQLKSDA